MKGDARISVPAELLAEAVRLAPSKLKRSMTRIVQIGLKLFIVQRKRQLFAKSMRRMVRDPQAMAIDRKLREELSEFDNDGLEGS